MADINIVDPVEFSNLINGLPPLEFYQQAPFPSEQSFDRLRQLIHAYLTPYAKTAPRITQKFIFSICTVLLFDTQSGILLDKILPSVLRCMKSWRLLSADEKNLDAAVDRLALDLAGLVNCRTSIEPDNNNKGPRRLRIRWIGADSELVDIRGLQFSEGESASTGSVVDVQYDETAVCPDISRHEMAAFRSGCCCCRKPRTSVSIRRPSCASTFNGYIQTKERPDPISSFESLASITPKSNPRPSSKAVDENVPPESSNSKKPYRRVIAKQSSTPGIRPRTNRNATPENYAVTAVPPAPRFAQSRVAHRTIIGPQTLPSDSNLRTQLVSRSSYSHASNPESKMHLAASTYTKCPSISSSSANHNSQTSSPHYLPMLSSARTPKPPFGMESSSGLQSSTRLVVPASSRVLRPRKGQV